MTLKQRTPDAPACVTAFAVPLQEHSQFGMILIYTNVCATHTPLARERRASVQDSVVIHDNCSTRR